LSDAAGAVAVPAVAEYEVKISVVVDPPDFRIT
jgi:hypothetical protein